MEVIAFGSSSCPACRTIAPSLMKLEERYAVKVQKVVPRESRETAQLAREHKVKVLPTLIKLVDGVEVARLEGGKPYAILEEFFTGGVS